MCAVVTNNRAKKYGRNAEPQIKLGDEFPIYHLSEMRTYDIEKDEVIERLAYRGQVSLFYAPPDTGKSYLALEIAVSLMLGRRVAAQLSVRPRTSCVLYIAAETDPDFKNRTIRAALKFNVSEGRLENLLNYFDGDALKFRLDDADWINRFAANYLHRFEARNELPDLIIIDTLRTAINGGDINENDNMAMSRVIGNAKLLCKALGNAACLLIHHTNRGKEAYAGAGSLEGDCHVVLHVQKDERSLSVFCEKNKLMKTNPKEAILAVQFVQTGDGVNLQPFDRNKVVRKQDGLNDAQRRVLQVIYDECKANRPPSYRTFGDLLSERYNEPKSVEWINKRKERSIDPLKSKQYIDFSSELTDKATTLLITAKGKQYIGSSGITEEDLGDDSAENQEDTADNKDE